MTNPPQGYESLSGGGSAEEYASAGVVPVSSDGLPGLDPAFPLDDPPPPPQPTSTPADNPSSSTTDVAKDEAGKVKDTAVDAGKDVAATVKDEAAGVVAETKQQAQTLLGSVSSQLKEQAGSQQSRLADTVHSWSKELGGMASRSDESGPLTDLAAQASRRAAEVAHFLQENEPADVLDQVSAFARRRPVVFLALCGLAGVVAGRVTRGAVAANTDVDGGGGTARRALPAEPGDDRSGPAAAAPVPVGVGDGGDTAVYPGLDEPTGLVGQPVFDQTTTR